MNEYKLLKPDLRLFDGAPVGASPVGTDEGPQAAQAGTEQHPGGGRRGRAGGLNNVGDSPAKSPDAGGDGKETPQARRARFEALVSGEFKDLFTERTQAIIDRRFKQVKQMEEQLGAARPVLDMLMQKYQIKDGGLEALARAVARDGGNPGQMEAFLQARQRKQGWQAMQGQLQDWYSQAGDLRTEYPGFQLDAECKDPRFVGMLRAGIPVRHAYEVLHLDDIKAGAARKMEKQVVDGIRAKGARPQENGMAAQGGVLVKRDLSKLTRTDREEIARRVARGETIRF